MKWGLLSLLFWLACLPMVSTAFQSQHKYIHRTSSIPSRVSEIGTKHTNAFPANRPSSTESLSMMIADADVSLGAWILGFASSHIGMSAIRSRIISTLADFLDSSGFNIIGREDWQLPSWWPGDDSGGASIFPDSDTAGRQIYRLLYTFISFWTLGSAFLAYLEASKSGISSGLFNSMEEYHNIWLFAASLSFGASIASLFNASPLGLMPGFASTTGNGYTNDRLDMTDGLPLQRDDSLKFSVRGLTRITRHPLILPVVPWGIATSVLAGGRTCDVLMFSGLSVYAIAGCFAQDLRVSKQEGSVGTVFRPTNSREEGDKLQVFFRETSFLPFGAVLDGRQSIGDVFVEFPWVPFLLGSIVGVYTEEYLLDWLHR